MPKSVTSKPFGLPRKSGLDRMSRQDWKAIEDFIQSRCWDFATPVLAEDRLDPLLRDKPSYGAFMMGFDFHLTPKGPRLIEINTNAGGLATVFALSQYEFEKEHIQASFLHALREEYRASGRKTPLRTIAIVDDDVTSQNLYPEMLAFADILKKDGLHAVVITPQELTADDSGLWHDGKRIDLIYNRLTDFRLLEETHVAIRRAAIQNQIILTPHPAVYVRCADKRNLLRLAHPLAPKAFLLKDRPLQEWVRTRKEWVFKPPEGAGSKGVYRGDKISQAKLAELPPATVVQEYVEPARNEDGSKQDLRVYTRGTEILGIASRHFTGQVMEMRSEKAGFRKILPEDACCFPMLIDEARCEVRFPNKKECPCPEEVPSKKLF